MKRKNGYKVRLQAENELDLEIYGVIESGQAFPDDPFISIDEVLATLSKVDGLDTLRLYMNSPGGDSDLGWQLKNRIERLQESGRVQTVEAHAEGIVASAATLPFLAADKRVMRNGSRFMIHKPWSLTIGNAEEHESAVNRLRGIEKEMLSYYESKSSLSREELETATAAETYYTPGEALEAGFATEIAAGMAVAACVSPALRACLQHFPDDMLTTDIASEAERDREETAKLTPPSEW